MAKRTGSLRLIDPPPEALDEPTTVDLPSTEIAPGTTLDDGVLHVEHGDGSSTIDFEPPVLGEKPKSSSFYRNLVEDLGDGVNEIAGKLIEGIERDIQSRKEWLDTRARGVQLLGLKLEEPRGDIGTSGAPLEGMATVRHPLLLEATIRFQATARGELLPSGGPVKVRNDTPQRPPQPPTPPQQPAPPAGTAPPSPQPPGMGGAGSPTPAPPANPQQPSLPSALPGGGGPAAGMGGAGIPSSPGAAPAPPPPSPPPNAQAAAPLATELAIPPTEERDSLAEALETDFNHYLTVTAPEYVPDTDRMLFYIGFGGDGFKKVYNCPLRRRPVSESVDAEHLIVSNSATDLKNCGRVTHEIKMRKAILRRMQIIGEYADIPIGEPVPNSADENPVDKEKADIFGSKPGSQRPEDSDYTIWECYCELDLEEFAPSQFKKQGLPLPYRVTIEKDSKKVLSVVRNWKEDDKECLAKQFFVQFPFIRGLGFYGLGFVHVLGNTTSTLTAVWREMLDGGMFANFPGFLLTKNAGRQLTNQMRIPPGGAVLVDVMQGTRIQDQVMPLPYKEPGAGFTAFAQWVEASGQRLGQTADISIGEGKQEAPVGTTLALIEQATKLLDSVHKRLHWAQNEEFSLLKERFKEDPEAFWRHNKKPSFAWEREQFLKALDDYNLVPVADPNNPTSLHRAAKAGALEALASKYPQLINQEAALKRVFRVAGIDSEGLFHTTPLPPPPDPRMAAIQQKAQSTQQTTQAQAQATLLKQVMQLKDNAADRESRERLEQMRIQLEGIKLREAGIIHQQEVVGDHVSRMAELESDKARTAQELQADQARTQHELMAGAIGKSQEIQIEDQKHRQRLQQQHEAHQLKLQHERELHDQRLQHEEALAAVKKKAQTKAKD